MGKKTVPIAVQIIHRKKVRRTQGFAIDVEHVVDNFRIIRIDNESKLLSGMHMCMKGKRFISFPCIIRKARIGSGPVLLTQILFNKPIPLNP